MQIDLLMFLFSYLSLFSCVKDKNRTKGVQRLATSTMFDYHCAVDYGLHVEVDMHLV